MNQLPHAEWLEADGLGGFASGTVDLIRTRRYHALLLAAANPPGERMVLVPGCDVWVETAHGTWAISSQRYAPSAVSPDGHTRLVRFTAEPWPTWTYLLPDGSEVVQELFVPRGAAISVLTWRLAVPRADAALVVRPFLCGRDYHGTHHENGDFAFAPLHDGRVLRWQPYAGVPAIAVLANAEYTHEPHWYRQFLYTEERERGLDAVEDLASPGSLRFSLGAEAVCIFAAETAGAKALRGRDHAVKRAAELREAERVRRAAFPSRLHRSAADYTVQRGNGMTIVAGYPWFLDWGRDTFIALRGLCLATDDLATARDILLEWAGTLSEGMLPNRFPDRGATPEYNAVDASLWYVIAVHDLLAHPLAAKAVRAADRRALRAAVQAIVGGYAAGTRYGIGMDDDGLLWAGEANVQLTWMDAVVDGAVVTPRIGKPVEVQALWLNALQIAGADEARWRDAHKRAAAAFAARFWHETRGCLVDVADSDRVRGRVDASLRPNQIFAVGGLPFAVLTGPRARAVVDVVERELYTPLGLRSLAPSEKGYIGRYQGDARHRDTAYHEGTVWPWLLGAFVEAWVRVRGSSASAITAARERFLPPLYAHLDAAGLGHVSEIADGDPPHTPRGCPFQAWSLGELLRLEHVVVPKTKPAPMTAASEQKASSKRAPRRRK